MVFLKVKSNNVCVLEQQRKKYKDFAGYYVNYKYENRCRW